MKGIHFMRKKHIIILLGIIILDQLTKMLAMDYFSSHSDITLIPHWLYLTILKNTGAAWGILSGKMWYFYIITIIALAVMGVLYHRTKASEPLVKVAFIFMIAGTLGNFIDRVSLQYVRDFIHMYVFHYDFPVFNVADMALVFGVFLIIWSEIRNGYGLRYAKK